MARHIPQQVQTKQKPKPYPQVHIKVNRVRLCIIRALRQKRRLLNIQSLAFYMEDVGDNKIRNSLKDKEEREDSDQVFHYREMDREELTEVTKLLEVDFCWDLYTVCRVSTCEYTINILSRYRELHPSRLSVPFRKLNISRNRKRVIILLAHFLHHLQKDFKFL